MSMTRRTLLVSVAAMCLVTAAGVEAGDRDRAKGKAKDRPETRPGGKGNRKNKDQARDQGNEGDQDPKDPGQKDNPQDNPEGPKDQPSSPESSRAPSVNESREGSECPHDHEDGFVRCSPRPRVRPNLAPSQQPTGERR